MAVTSDRSLVCEILMGRPREVTAGTSDRLVRPDLKTVAGSRPISGAAPDRGWDPNSGSRIFGQGVVQALELDG